MDYACKIDGTREHNLILLCPFWTKKLKKLHPNPTLTSKCCTSGMWFPCNKVFKTRSYSVALATLDPPACASRVLRLKAQITMPSYQTIIYSCNWMLSNCWKIAQKGLFFLLHNLNRSRTLKRNIICREKNS